MKFFSVFFFCLVFNATASVDVAWKNNSDPLIMSQTFVRSVNHLPLTGKVFDEQKFWSGDYWALKKGNINYRWNSPQPKGFEYVSPTREEVFQMSQDILATLSPAEKYDLFVGDYSYALKNEVTARTSPDKPLWEGMCHGWSPAMMYHNEPTPKVVQNPEGLIIPFGSADIKGLISYYYAYKYDAPTTRQMGLRCSFWPFGPDRCKDDLNAGAFHIALTNRMGLQGQSFVTDIEKGTEVWNHVPVNYQSTIVNAYLPPEKDSAKGTVRTMRVKTDVAFVFSADKNSWWPTKGTADQIERKKNYEYSLDIDQNGIIIGGKWISKVRPDFIWLVDRAPEFTDRWSRLPELLND